MVVLDDDAPEEDLDLLQAHKQNRASGVFSDVLPCRLSEFFEDASVCCTIAYDMLRNGVLLHNRLDQPQTDTGKTAMTTEQERKRLYGLTPFAQVAYLTARGQRSREDRFAEILAKAGTTDEVLPGDEIPEGWLDDADRKEETVVAPPQTGR